MTDIELIRRLYEIKRPDLIVNTVKYKNEPDHLIEGYDIWVTEQNGRIGVRYMCIESIPSLWGKWREEQIDKILSVE